MSRRTLGVSCISSATVLGVAAGLMVGVVVGRVSKTSHEHEPHNGRRTSTDKTTDRESNLDSVAAVPPGAEAEAEAEATTALFESEGWEGEADVFDWEPFRLLGRSMVDYIANYYRGVESRPVRAQVEPGYLKGRLPQKEFPLKGEKWSNIMADVESHVMPGITHWQHPRFFAWYPANSSPPAILGDMLATMFNVIGFSWEASPASTELETIVMDNLARAMGLPECFSSRGGGEGGGVIQGSASEGTLVALLAARTRALKHMRRSNPGVSDHELLSKMTLYASDQAHSSVQKAANIAGLGDNLRLIPTTPLPTPDSPAPKTSPRAIGATIKDKLGWGWSRRKNQGCPYGLDAEDLALAMQLDRREGFTPVFVSANVGSTNSCAVDPVKAIAEVCHRGERDHPAGDAPAGNGPGFLLPWLHVDAAYAGAATICPEHRWILEGIEAADSYLFNLHKWLLVNFDATGMWVKRSAALVEALSVTPAYLMSKEYQRGQVSDFRDWQVPLGRKFRSLKIWFTMRAFGLEKIRQHIRRHIELVSDFATLVEADDRFEIVAPVRFGLVCFRLKASDEANEQLRSRITSSGFAFFSSTKLGGQTCLRISVGAAGTQERHVRELWDALQRETAALEATM